MLGVLAAPLHLGLVVRLGERLLLAGQFRPRAVGGIVELGLSDSIECEVEDDSPWDGNAAPRA